MTGETFEDVAEVRAGARVMARAAYCGLDPTDIGGPLRLACITHITVRLRRSARGDSARRQISVTTDEQDVCDLPEKCRTGRSAQKFCFLQNAGMSSIGPGLFAPELSAALRDAAAGSCWSAIP